MPASSAPRLPAEPIRSPAAALSFFYLTSFAVLGVYLPYMNLYFAEIGFSGLQIGLLSALVPLSGALVPPAAGLLADRIGRRRPLVAGSALLALLAFGFLFAARRFAGVAWALGAWAVLRAPALPLVEASAIELSEAGGRPYGRMRAWGSIAFIAVSLTAGRLLAVRGAASVLPATAAFLTLNLLSALRLPADGPGPCSLPPAESLRGLLGRRSVLAFLAACVLSQASHGPYYVFYSIRLEKAGYGAESIGMLWALAVGCEVLAMLAMPRVLSRLGTLPTITVSLLCASARWWICSTTTALAPMILGQTLHAATYAAFHVAAVTHTHRLFGAARRASGQAIYSAATYGVGNVVGMVLSGLFYDRAGAGALFAGASWVALAGCVLVLGATGRGARRGGGSIMPPFLRSPRAPGEAAMTGRTPTDRALRIGHSPDADDAFMFYALARGLVPTPGYRIEQVLMDIESLNRLALEGGIEVTAVSFHAYAHLADRYALLPCGASLGDGYGPLVVARRPMGPGDLRSVTVAVPGLLTSAVLALRLAVGEVRVEVMPFDRILDAVAEGRAEAGLLIHEGQLTYGDRGVHRVIDLGAWWRDETGLPLPLGGNAVRRDLGETAIADVARLLRQSIAYGLEHREEALGYALEFGRGIPRRLADRFVGMYVNEFTLDYGERGRRAVETFLRRGHEAGLLPRRPEIAFLP
jgi:1,4-dihydroxy-6-naphthoate synthase